MWTKLMLAITLAVLCAAGEGQEHMRPKETVVEPRQSTTQVEQVASAPLPKSTAIIDTADLPAIEGRRATAAMGQLPDDIEVSEGDQGPETSLVSDRVSPRAELYTEVAEVWAALRKQGQQPTPELIAREIGPDTLTRFLDQFPGAEQIFGRDSDNLPLAYPESAGIIDSSGTRQASD